MYVKLLRYQFTTMTANWNIPLTVQVINIEK